MKSKSFFTILLMILTVSLAMAESPDYGNTSDEAFSISPDSTVYQGYIDSNDEDWFVFTPTANTLYRVTLTGQINMGYKSLNVYQEDEFGDLTQTIHTYVWSNATAVQTFFIESSNDVYIKLYDNTGNYSFHVDTIGQYPPDSYSDDCATASPLVVDAAATEATLTHNPDDSLESDWFEFDTTALHMYQISITYSDNTNVSFRVYDDNCEQILDWSKTVTITSWFGESYKILVSGNPVYVGTYYTIRVVDLGLQNDDYSNVVDTADPITPDGGIISGRVDFDSTYQSDQDWFTFTPTPQTLYRVTLTGQDGAGYKSMNIYQIDEFDNLHQTIHNYVWSNDTEQKTFFIESGDDIYLKLYDNNGDYSYSIENLGNYPQDSYSNDCATASPITVDAAPIEATLTHNPDGSIEPDWFEFDTVALHKYEIRLTCSDNTNVNFSVYSQDCDYLLGWSKTATITSWFGESYKILASTDPSYLGSYYTLEVVDLGLQEDDYPNTSATAIDVPKDNTVINGEIEYLSSLHNDEDWFTFVAAQDGDYGFSLTGEYGQGYKSMNIYTEDELGVLHEVKHSYVWSDATTNYTVNLTAGVIYVKLYDNLGQYSFTVDSPEPRCGDLDHPYPAGDANQDCYVNLEDVAILATNWLSCSAPECD